MESKPVLVRKIILEDLIRRMARGRHDALRGVLDGACAAVVNGEQVQIVSADKRRVVVTLATVEDVAAFEKRLRKAAQLHRNPQGEPAACGPGSVEAAAAASG
jgi:hypothetical protein